MATFPGLVLAMAFVLVPSSDSQCIDCQAHWDTKCNINRTGHFCLPGTRMNSIYNWEEPDLRNVYKSCVPQDYFVRYINGWCCFWSEQFGCQAAVNPHIYHQGNPLKFCRKCRTLCNCNGAPKLLGIQFWQEAMNLASLLLILFQILT